MGFVCLVCDSIIPLLESMYVKISLEGVETPYSLCQHICQNASTS